MLENFMLISFVIVNTSLLAILIRLHIKHRHFFEQKEFGDIFYGSIHKLAGLFEFIFKRKYSKLDDPILAVTCIIFVISFLVSFPLMFITIFFHK